MGNENSSKEIWISEAQKEVWEWKESLYEKIKDLPKAEQLKYIVEGGKKIREELKEMRTNQQSNT